MHRPDTRPTVRMMMATTADGKIATVAREAARFGSEEDERRLRDQVAWADALLVAAGTLRAYGATFVVREPKSLRERARAGQRPQPISVILTRSLDLPLDLPFFTRQQLPRMVVTTRPHEAAAREKFGTVAEVLAMGSEEVDVSALVRALGERGVGRLLALGGGSLNYSLVAAGLVDELLLTVSPFLFGGARAPTILDGPGFSLDRAVRLRLVTSEVVGDEVFLRYRLAPRG